MSEPTQEEVISIVSSQFEVTNVDLTLDTLKFRIEDREFKSKFVGLAQKLEARDLVCRMEKSSDGMYILVNRFPPRKQRKWLSSSWTPGILFAIVIGLVMIDGYYRTIGANTVITSRGLTVNRHILYDVAIAGPIAGLAIAIIVSMYGAYTAPVITDDLADDLFSR